MTTPILSLEELAAAQDQPDVPINADLRALEVVIQLAVLDMAATLPVTPSEGDRYILTADDGGGQKDQVAYYSGGWKFIWPGEGWLAYVRDEAQYYLWGSGSPSGWAKLSTINGVFDAGGGGGGGPVVDFVEMVLTAGAADVDLSSGADEYHVVLTEALTALSISNPDMTAGKLNRFRLVIQQDNTGGWMTTIPANWTMIGEAATIMRAASACEVLDLVSYDNGTTWLVKHAAFGTQRDLIVTDYPTSTVYTLTMDRGKDFDLTLTEDCAFLQELILSTYGHSFRYRLVVRQDGTGGWTFNPPAHWKFPGGTPYVASSAAGAVDVLDVFVTIPYTEHLVTFTNGYA